MPRHGKRDDKAGESSTDSKTWTEFTRNAEDSLSKLIHAGRPVYLTVKGKAEVVVQSAESYRQLLERVETIEGLHRGLREMEEGKTSLAADAFEQIRNKHGIPGRAAAALKRCVESRAASTSAL